ncbi:MAG: hypothetical protein R2755_27770 [Acidimicrobiales bacterium]
MTASPLAGDEAQHRFGHLAAALFVVDDLGHPRSGTRGQARTRTVARAAGQPYRAQVTG